MNCCNDYGQCTQGQDCPARPAAVAPIKLTRARTCEELGLCQSKATPCAGCAPIEVQPAPALRAAMDDELPASKWDLLWFWGTVSVTGVCTLIVTVGGLGWVYGKYMA